MVKKLSVNKLINHNTAKSLGGNYHRPEGAGNFDNMDDYNIVNHINIQSGTVDRTPTDDKHLANKKYVDDNAGGSVPIGTVVMYGSTTPPTGWLNCDGSLLVYAINPEYLPLFNVIGTTYGGSVILNQFNLPDFRGIFPRGQGTNGTLSDSSSTAFTSTIGDYQDDAMQQITGSFGSQRLSHNTVNVQNSGAFSPYSTSPTAECTNSTEGGEYTGFDFDSDDSTSPNDARTDTAETRPANLSINFIIKY